MLLHNILNQNMVNMYAQLMEVYSIKYQPVCEHPGIGIDIHPHLLIATHILVAMRVGVTPVPIPNTMVKT